MKEAENPMVIDRPTIPTPHVYKLKVTATVEATIEVTADDEEYIDLIIDDYADSVMAEADNCEIDDWEVISVEDWEADYE
ncbi:MAG: hypothetical protein E6Z25_07220 [Negativicoccus succinicivorans]|uniref:hypothetical protein n=1 Tax=Negativicoccus succinicivorans TaxID=620903 RepID=UPI0007643846|nr:hypothetical protein [Negativicoccus succinicivorans]KWZ79912.1 hypothetical protein HMPREF3224_02345 [Anaerococcus hydrogenalis]MDU5915834.1 hypothetical protein [Negativicoccus succinicivorans]